MQGGIGPRWGDHMSGRRIGYSLLFLLCLGSFLHTVPAWSAGEQDLLAAAEKNPLLMEIYRKDPGKAQAFWMEMQSMIEGQAAEKRVSRHPWPI